MLRSDGEGSVIFFLLSESGIGSEDDGLYDDCDEDP